MSTLKLRNLYAKKISKSLNKVIEQITLLNNIDNNIILNNNLISDENNYSNNLSGGADIAESKTYLTGGAEQKGDNSNCDTTIIDNIESSINSSSQSYNVITTGIELIIDNYNKQKLELVRITELYDRERQDKASLETNLIEKNRQYNEAKRQLAEITKQSAQFTKLLDECTKCKTQYLTKLAQIKQQIDINNNRLGTVDTNVRRVITEMKQ